MNYGAGSDLSRLFSQIAAGKSEIAKAVDASHATEEEKASAVQEEEQLDPVSQALAELEAERRRKDSVLAQVDKDRADAQRKQDELKAEEAEGQRRIIRAGKEAAKGTEQQLLSENARQRRDRDRRIQAARAKKEAQAKEFEAAVEASVQAKLNAEKAAKEQQEADNKVAMAQSAAKDAEKEVKDAEDNARRAKDIADKASAAAQKAIDDEDIRRKRIAELEAEIKRLEQEEAAEVEKDKKVEDTPAIQEEPKEPSNSQPIQPVNDVEEPEEEDDFEILDVVPSVNVAPTTYRGYKPVSDKQNTFASAMQPINSFDAVIYFASEYDRHNHRGSFTYYIVTTDKEKNVMYSECGFTDDSFEYAFLGALLMLQVVVKNKIRQVLIIVQDELIRDVLIQNAMAVLDNFSQTRSEYAEFMRQYNGLKFVAKFAVADAAERQNKRHAKYLNLVSSIAKSILKD